MFEHLKKTFPCVGITNQLVVKCGDELGSKSSNGSWFECDWNLFLEGLLCSRRQHVLVPSKKLFIFFVTYESAHGNNSLVLSPLVQFPYRMKLKSFSMCCCPIAERIGFLLGVLIYRSLTQVLKVKNMGDFFQKLALVPISGDFMVNSNVLPYEKFQGVVFHNLRHPIVEGRIPTRNIVQWFGTRVYF